MQVVSVDMVRRAIGVIGHPEIFGGEKRGFSHRAHSTVRHLTRSADNRFIGGVCGGIAEYFNLDPSVVRLIAVLLIFPGGLALLAYIIMWIILPQGPNYVKYDG
jgi:phage shock protein PspC (stress-responsive transcriptional regulator)